MAEWAALLGCEVGKGELKYLGATLGASPTRLKYWDPLLNKVQARVQSYDSSTLSIAGRTVLLKAVIDSIPAYWFSLFKLPSAIINKIEKIRRKFLWGGKAGNGAKRTLHSLSWNKVCSPKSCGGLGLVSIRHRNEVLLAKWVWRAYNERDRYWNKILGVRYGRMWNYDLSKVATGTCSPIVKSIVSTHLTSQLAPILGQKFFKWILRSGDTILFWEDWWISDVPLCQ